MHSENKVTYRVVIFQPCVTMRMENTQNAALVSKTPVIVMPMLKRGLVCNSNAYKRALHRKFLAIGVPRTSKSSVCRDRIRCGHLEYMTSKRAKRVYYILETMPRTWLPIRWLQPPLQEKFCSCEAPLSIMCFLEYPTRHLSLVNTPHIVL